MTESQEVLGAELAQKMDIEIAQALTDAPPRTDIARSGVQNQIINTDNDPQRWADICNLALYNLALKTSQSSTERKIFLKLERINGIRRVKNIYLCAVQRGLNQLIHEIYLLPDDEWKNRLKGLWAYHSAIIYEALCQYNKSAECHNITESLDGDEFSVRCARYMEARARLLDAILHDQSTYTPSIDLQKATKEFEGVLSVDIEKDARWFWNIQMHDIGLQIYGSVSCFMNRSNLGMVPEIFRENALLSDARNCTYSHGKIRIAEVVFELAHKTGEVAGQALLIILNVYGKHLQDHSQAEKVARQIIALNGNGLAIPRKIATNYLEGSYS